MKNHFILALVLLTTIRAASAAPTGKIGFIGTKGAQIWDLRSGKISTIPRSAKTESFTLSPRGEAVFLVPNGKKSKDQWDLSDAFLSRAPYTRSAPIRALQGVSPYSFLWSTTGNSLYLKGYEQNTVFTPVTGKASKLNFSPDGFDAQSRLVGYSTDKEVIVRDVKTGENRVFFSTQKPKPLFDALRRAQNPKNISNLMGGEAMLKESYAQWQLAGPAISPDGKLAYFATNAGTGFGAAGNGMQGYFTCDLKTGKLSVMSKVGEDFGRPPDLTISPDGKRLLSVLSVHSNAADNSSFATIIDLETQKTREILFNIPGSKDRANLFGGSAWSPDGKYVALSAYFYDADKAMDSVAKNGDWPEPPASAWKTAIFDAATGKIWGLKTGMQSPSWSR